MRYPKQLVEVTWVDAGSTHGWETDTEADLEPEIITTVGFIIAGNKESVIIASTIDATGVSNNCRLKIPVNMITSIKQLKIGYYKKTIDPTKTTIESPEPSLQSSELLVP